MNKIELPQSIDSIGLEVSGMMHMMCKYYSSIVQENKLLKEENAKLKSKDE